MERVGAERGDEKWTNVSAATVPQFLLYQLIAYVDEPDASSGASVERIPPFAVIWASFDDMTMLMNAGDRSTSTMLHQAKPEESLSRGYIWHEKLR